MVLAHITFCTPYVILSVLPRLKQMNPNIYEAALDLGAVRFEFEKLWQAEGGNIRSRAFYTALRDELARYRSEVTEWRTLKQKMSLRER